MGYRVEFVYAEWIVAYPQFTNIDQNIITGAALPLAEVYWRNDGTGLATSYQTQKTILWLAVAHIAQLMYGQMGANGPQPGGLVGRVNSATEGSVSVSTADFPDQSPSAAWWNQTPYGAAFWQATSPYRTMRYVPMLGVRPPLTRY